jgi:putative ABC transport system permease protein
MARLPALGKLDVAAGSWRDLGPGKVVLSGFAGDITGLRVGDEARLKAGDRTVDLTVAALLPGSAPLNSTMVLDPSDLTRLGAPAGFSGLLADAARGGEDGRTAGQQALRQVTGARHGVTGS